MSNAVWRDASHHIGSPYADQTGPFIGYDKSREQYIVFRFGPPQVPGDWVAEVIELASATSATQAMQNYMNSVRCNRMPKSTKACDKYKKR